MLHTKYFVEEIEKRENTITQSAQLMFLFFIHVINQHPHLHLIKPMVISREILLQHIHSLDIKPLSWQKGTLS